MQNNRKRLLQNANSGPRSGQHTEFRPGPSGAAGLPGLMPVGGFGGKNQQRGTLPTSGRGAATFNRSTPYNNVGSYPIQQGQLGNRAASSSNASSTSLQYQQGVRQNTAQNRNIPTGRGRSATQQSNRMSSNSRQATVYPSNQTGPNAGHSNSNIYGGGGDISQNNWGRGQQPYNNTNMKGNSTRISSFGCSNTFNQNSNSFNQGNNFFDNRSCYPPRNETRSIYHQTYPNQQQQYMPWPNREIQLYNVYQHSNRGVIKNQAEEISEEWNNSFTEPTPVQTQTANKAISNVVKANTNQKTALMELEKSLHFLTVDIQGMKRWNKFKDSVQMMFEIIGQLDSATAKGSMECKEFLIRDEKKSDVTCVFYEIDRQLPKITRGQWYRLVGKYDGMKEIFHCLSIRTRQSAEINTAYLLSQKSTEVMCKLTSTMRES